MSHASMTTTSKQWDQSHQPDDDWCSKVSKYLYYWLTRIKVSLQPDLGVSANVQAISQINHQKYWWNWNRKSLRINTSASNLMTTLHHMEPNTHAHAPAHALRPTHTQLLTDLFPVMYVKLFHVKMNPNGALNVEVKVKRSGCTVMVGCPNILYVTVHSVYLD